MNRRAMLFGYALLAQLATPAAVAFGGEPPAPAITAIQQEIARTMQLEIEGLPKPHHVAVTLIGEEATAVEANLGSIVSKDHNRDRVLKLEMRVGDPSFDSFNFLGTEQEAVLVVPAPMEDDGVLIRQTLWLMADRVYKNASETFEAKRAHVESMAQGTDEVPDFSQAPVVKFQERAHDVIPSVDVLATLAREASAVFMAHPNIHRSFVRAGARARTRTFVDSAGTVIEDGSILVRVEIVAQTQADDGMMLTDHVTVLSGVVGDLPAASEVAAQAKALAERLEEARVAPVVDDYAGPVLFEGRAGPQLLRFLLADELSATPPPEPAASADASAGSSLSSRVGWRVLPLGFEVVDDPTVAAHAGHPLIGRYGFDDEGVRAERVGVVGDGTLLSLLSSRTPSVTMVKSNGHGRSGTSGHARGRASNMLVTVRDGMDEPSLRRRLLAAARAEGLDYGIIVAGLDEPALTHSEGVMGSSHLPEPAQIYRLRAGSKPERVRGGLLQGLRSRDLRHIVAAGRRPYAYSYMASSSPIRVPGVFGGDITTSIVAPSVLMPDVDVTKPTAPHPLPPIVTRPSR